MSETTLTPQPPLQNTGEGELAAVGAVARADQDARWRELEAAADGTARAVAAYYRVLVGAGMVEHLAAQLASNWQALTASTWGRPE